MKEFIYKYKEEGSQKIQTAIIEAENKLLAVREIKDSGKKLISIEKKKIDIDDIKTLLKSSRGGTKIDKKTMSMMFSQLAFMRSSGLALHKSLETLKNSTTNKAVKDSLTETVKLISGGMSFSAALETQKNIYSDQIVYQVKSGEKSGDLENTMNQIAHTLDKEVKFAKKIKSALTYPIMVIMVTIVIVYFLMTKVVPSMTTALTSMGSELPLITKVVIKLSDFISKYGGLIVFVNILIVGIFIYLYKNNRSVKLTVDILIIKSPYVGSLIFRLKVSRFCRLLSSLQGSGVPMVPSLGIVKSAMGNLYLESKFEDVISLIERNGMSPATAFKEVKIFPELLTQLMIVGTESGKLKEVLELLANNFEEEVDDSLKKVLSYVDTLLIILIGAVVGLVVLSMFLPMFSFIQEF